MRFGIFFLMFSAQSSGQAEIFLGFFRVTRSLKGFSYIQIKRRVKFLYAVIAYLHGMVQCFLVPYKYVLRISLAARHIMGSHTGLIIIAGGLPGLHVKFAGCRHIFTEF